MWRERSRVLSQVLAVSLLLLSLPAFASVPRVVMIEDFTATW